MKTLQQRLDELFKLPPGWLDGEGRVIDPVLLRMAGDVLGDPLLAELQRPAVFPTPAGRVVAEWSLKDRLVACYFYVDEILIYCTLTGADEDEYRATPATAATVLKGLL